MGNNAAYTVWEEQVIRLYDAGVLSLFVLDEVCEPYRGTDIDSGGRRDLESHDGKSVEQICVELVEPEFKSVSYEEEPVNGWTYHDEFSEVSHKRWGWC